MSRSKLLATAFAAVAFSFTGAQADGSEGMEKCKVVDENGKGLIKEHKADCASKNNSCSAHNKAADAEAWILVPTGECDKINKGDFSGISEEIKDKIEMDDMTSEE